MCELLAATAALFAPGANVTSTALTVLLPLASKGSKRAACSGE